MRPVEVPEPNDDVIQPLVLWLAAHEEVMGPHGWEPLDIVKLNRTRQSLVDHELATRDYITALYDALAKANKMLHADMLDYARKNGWVEPT